MEKTELQNIRYKLRMIKVKKATDTLDFGSRQQNLEEDVFNKVNLDKFDLLSPPYDPIKLDRIVESSGTLGSCVEVMVDNVTGFGHELQYRGDKDDLKNPDVVKERDDLKEFFKRVNETQSFTKLRKELRRDYETTGNSYLEVVRYTDGHISTLYRADARYMRLQIKQTNEVKVEIPLSRKGKIVSTTIRRKFRRFAMITSIANAQVRWFKEYGDPRKMCAISGKYGDELDDGEKIIEDASEIIHFKQGNDTYGIPRWVGMSSTILGVRDADYVNYNLFSDQGIPPLAILVSGGRLTQDSVEDLAAIFESRKGVENFHKIAILEAAPADGDIDEIASQAKIDFKPLPQQDDILFGKYIDSSEGRIRAKFRIPALYLGLGEEFSRSTSQNIKLIAEEQAYTPERKDEDEIINFTLMADLNATKWKFRTIGPKLIEGSEAIDAIGKFARAGSLSINQAIKIMNRVLDLDAPLYNEEWADYPATMILELSKRGWLKDSDKFAEVKNIVSNVVEEAEKNEELRQELFEKIEEIRPVSEIRLR